jgi:hypothetical protein
VNAAIRINAKRRARSFMGERGEWGDSSNRANRFSDAVSGGEIMVREVPEISFI